MVWQHSFRAKRSTGSSSRRQPRAPAISSDRAYQKRYVGGVTASQRRLRTDDLSHCGEPIARSRLRARPTLPMLITLACRRIAAAVRSSMRPFPLKVLLP